MTAGHCISNNDFPDPTFPDSVRLGPRTRSDGTRIFVDAAASVIHPDWNCDASGCFGGFVGEDVDLALLKLNTFSTNEVVCLNTDSSRPSNGQLLDIMGFGETDDFENAMTFQGATVTTTESSCANASPGYLCYDATPTDTAGSSCPGKNYRQQLGGGKTNSAFASKL